MHEGHGRAQTVQLLIDRGDCLPAWLTSVTIRLCVDRLRARTAVPGWITGNRRPRRRDPWRERWSTISRYPRRMRAPTAATLRLRAALELHRSRVGGVLDQYGATNLRLFGSVARGDAREDSDLDLLVDLAPGAGNEMLRVSGLAEELSELLGVRVDVVAATLLRDEVSATALGDAVAV